MIDRFSHGYALLIGVGESAYPKWSLPVTVRDVQALRAMLVDAALCGYPDDEDHVRLLHDAGATRQAILNGLAWLRDRANADAEATVVVYYSGHGWLDEGTGQYYLVAHDVEPVDVPGSTLAAQVFGEALRGIRARRLLVAMDCCHAEGMATAKDKPALKLPAGLAEASLPEGVAGELKQGEGRAVLASCRGSQRSWVRPDGTLSLYTHHLLEALQGAGNRPGDTLVRVSSLMGHLGQAVPASARRLCQAEQTPFFDAATEDFPVAVLRGGKGLPAGGWQAMRAEAERAIEGVVQAVIRGSGSVAQGAGAQAAGERAVVGRDIGGPVVTGDHSIGAGRDVILAPGSSRIQIGGGIQAGQIHAQNVASGVQVVGVPDGPDMAELRRQVAALREQLARAVAAGEMADPADAEDAHEALATAEQELAAPQPRGSRVVRRLAEVAEILTRGAEATEALGKAGTHIVKLAPIAATLYQVAQKLFGG